MRLIAPRHSAYTHYLTEADTEFIPATLAPAVFEGSMGAEDAQFFKDVSWWQPDEAAAEAIIRRIIDAGGASKPSPQERICRTYTWSQAAGQLLAAIDHID